jgi:hypothetical protein
MYYRVCFEVTGTTAAETVLFLSYSESPAFAGPDPDATTNTLDRDLPLQYVVNSDGPQCVGPEYVRGAFKYLTLYISSTLAEDGFWHQDIRPSRLSNSDDGQRTFQSELDSGLSLSSLSVNCTAFPSNPNPRAYTGYFSSSSNLLNRIWYAGAYTLQLTTISPLEGCSLLDYNGRGEQNGSPVGSWYSNFTISNGSAVTTDGAKRDRMVWPGDMSIAVPGIAMSTYDMVAVRNALDTLFAHQYGNGELPYAGPPMGSGGEFSDTYHLHTLLGVYNYVLFSGDLAWLESHWDGYGRALNVSLGKVDELNLLHVTSTADWLRPGLTGHSLSASVLLFMVLERTPKLAAWINQPLDDAWDAMVERLRAGIETLYCTEKGLYGDNAESRGCGGADETHPQDGNSFALYAHILDQNPVRANNISQNLQGRWNAYGAPAVEFPTVISPFISSFELLAHTAAGNIDTAFNLTLQMWGYMLDGEGFTNSTLVEGYSTDGNIKYPAYASSARNSHAHGWSTGPTSVLINGILGIELLAPAGDEWSIKPMLPTTLDEARGGFATAYGSFEVRLTRVNGAEVLFVRTPRESRGRLEWAGESLQVGGGWQMWVVKGQTLNREEFEDEATAEEEWRLELALAHKG